MIMMNQMTAIRESEFNHQISTPSTFFYHAFPQNITTFTSGFINPYYPEYVSPEDSRFFKELI